MHEKTQESPTVNGALIISGGALFFFTLFPYIALLPIQTDSQPNAVLFAALIFLLGRNTPLPLPIWALFTVFLGAVILFLVTGATFNGLRSLAGYGSLFLISAGFFILAKNGVRLSNAMLDASVYIWGIVGALQLFVSRDFLTFLTVSARTDETRGVTSLAVEPSAYVTVMLFMLLVYFLRRRERSFPAVFCILQSLLLAQAALGVLFVFIALALYALLRLSAPAAILNLAALAVGFFLLMSFSDVWLAGTRFGSLLSIVFRTPGQILMLDASVAERASSIFYSIHGAFENWLLPHGFDAWIDYSDRQDQIYSDVFFLRGGRGRIMSGYGNALFELGAFGLIVPLVVTAAIRHTFGSRENGRFLATFVLLHLLMITPVPLALPLVGFLIGDMFANPVREGAADKTFEATSTARLLSSSHARIG